MTTTKAPELSTKTDAEIDQWIRNHEQRNATSSSLYKKLLEERAARSKAKGLLEIEKSLVALKQAAKEQRFITYGDLASVNHVPWTKARHRMNGTSGHLDLLLDVCHARGLPLLPAICVNESGRTTGTLEAAALAGFIAGALRVRAGAGELPIIGDEKEFHRKTCEECFKWGREN